MISVSFLLYSEHFMHTTCPSAGLMEKQPSGQMMKRGSCALFEAHIYMYTVLLINRINVFSQCAGSPLYLDITCTQLQIISTGELWEV